MEDLIWHYTKMGVLEKIFPPKRSEKYKKGKIRLRFTDIRFLNDRLEGLVFEKFFENHKKEILKSLPKELKEVIRNSNTKDMKDLDGTYVFSTSGLKDSLVFWNKEYAGLDGFAIAFDNNNTWDGLKGKNIVFRDVYYISLSEKEEDFVKEVVRDLTSDSALSKALSEVLGTISSSSPEETLSSVIGTFSFLCKNKSWGYEKEMRMVKLASNEDTDIEFNANKIIKISYEYFDKSIVDNIMLGPNCNDEQVKAVKEYLDKNGYDNILVEKSHAFEL
jgi:hypothetical protein